MNKRTPIIKRAFLATLILAAIPGVALAQPSLTACSFSPNAINTGNGSADVTLSFTLTDTASPVFYLETAFTDSSGTFVRRGIKSRTSPPMGPWSDTVAVSFPQFSAAGDWKVLAVFAADLAGNTLYLDNAGLSGFQCGTGTLTVSSAVDTTPPNITQFSFSPTSIDTTSAAKNVTVTFRATDDKAVSSVYVGFLSPSGQTKFGTRVSAPADFSSGTTIDSTLVISFPQGIEAGAWKISFINVTDAAGNNLFLDTAAAASQFPSAQTLTVTTQTDTTAPNLNAFTLSTSSISTNGGPVGVNFTVTDDISGANDLEVSFSSPSGSQTVLGAVAFTPTLPNTPYNGSLTANFPVGTEAGTWTTASVFLADAAGNTRFVSQPITLTVTEPGADTTPPVIIPTVSPLPNGSDWNNTLPVTVTWSVTDPETNIASSTGCGPTTFTAPTTGTTLTCSATNGRTPTPLTNSVSVVVKIDISPPITTNVLATPNPIPLGADLTITATVTDAGGSNVASAEFKVDDGPFDDLAGPFNSSSVNVSVTFPGSNPLLTQPGVHTICVRGTDFADNVSAAECVVVAVHGVNSTTAGGGTNSPAGADPTNPTGSGPVTFGFNSKYGPGDSVPSGNFEFHYKAGNLDFKQDSYDFMVVTNGNRAQIQGTGTLNKTSVCKFAIDAYDNSFLPGNVDAFGLTIYNCDGGTTTRYALPVTPTTKGNIEVRQ
jgi:hypothetical protein